MNRCHSMVSGLVLFVLGGCSPVTSDRNLGGGATSARVKVLSKASSSIEALSYVRHEPTSWIVLFGVEMNGKWIPLVEHDGKAVPRERRFKALNPGDRFFNEGPLRHRFKFLGFEERVVENARLGIVETMKFARFRDMDAAKKGRVHEVPSRLPRSQWHEYMHYEESARFIWRPMGQEAQDLLVREGRWFQLPGNGSSRKYLLKRVMPESVTVQWREGGEIRTRVIPNRDSTMRSFRTIRDMLGR